MQGEAMAWGVPMAKALFKAPVADSAAPAPPVPVRPPAEAQAHPQGATRPRIVFVLMSAVARADTVDQLAQALAPHPVLVHHDFSQTPHFALSAGNVRFVPNPVRTGWAQFGFVEGIFHALQHALDTMDFDYVQLLSPSCLPIKPLAEFERHISALEDAHFDCVDLLSDPDALACVGYRAWTAEGSFMHRLMRRLCRIHYQGARGRREEAGIWLRSQPGHRLSTRLAGLALRALAHPALGRHLRQQPLRLYYGSTWFGARRHIVAHMLRTWRQPGVRQYFSKVRIAEEFLVPSLLMKTHPHKGHSNHLVQHFEEAHPGLFSLEELPRLRQSPAFFARKFPDDPQAPVRQQVLSELVQAPQALPATAPAPQAATA